MPLPSNHKKIAFIHGRPSGHPVHAKYAHSINADFFHEDKFIRWHDNPKASKLRRYLSWIINAFFFPKKKEYDIILTECIRIPQLIMKKLKLINNKQKLIALMGDESLYFLFIKKYPTLTNKLMLAFLNSCDVVICTSKFQSVLAKEIVTNKSVKIKTMFNGLPVQRFKNIVMPTLIGQRIIFIGNIDASWRGWYKGLDLVINSFLRYSINNPLAKLTIVGTIEKSVKHNLLNKHIGKNEINNIVFAGKSENLTETVLKHDLLLHPGRGEAWGVAIHIALICGIPAMVSNFTGAKEMVTRIDEKLLIDLDEESITEKIEWYFNLPINDKLTLSKKSRAIAKLYTEEQAISSFQELISCVP